ncbi:MAG TPA: VOC family protein [Polyangiaceae bacterium]|nr:VOC family protein [Polyangiaceae bacterium]
MGAARFTRYAIRTTEPQAARAFYEEVLATDLWDADVKLSRLPEQAIARGAPPHWLGHLGVDDVEGTVNRLVALGRSRSRRKHPAICLGQHRPSRRKRLECRAVASHSHALAVFFRVANVEDRLALVRARGAIALEPAVTPNGERVAVCDDPQGAAFALIGPAPS